MPGKSHPVEIEPRAGLGELLQRCDVIFEAPGLVEMAVGKIVKSLVTPRGSAAIDDDHRKSERGE
jgi:hypothetical protein